MKRKWNEKREKRFDCFYFRDVNNINNNHSIVLFGYIIRSIETKHNVKSSKSENAIGIHFLPGVQLWCINIVFGHFSINGFVHIVVMFAMIKWALGTYRRFNPIKFPFGKCFYLFIEKIHWENGWFLKLSSFGCTAYYMVGYRRRTSDPNGKDGITYVTNTI